MLMKSTSRASAESEAVAAILHAEQSSGRACACGQLVSLSLPEQVVQGSSRSPKNGSTCRLSLIKRPVAFEPSGMLLMARRSPVDNHGVVDTWRDHASSVGL